MEIGRWNGHIFEVSPKTIKSFEGLQIKSGSQTEDKTSSGQDYASRKSGRATEVSITVKLNAFAGVDVQKESVAFLEDARKGEKDYFYIGNKKLLSWQLMLTDANVSNTEIASGGKWKSAEVHLTLKQAQAGSSGSSGSSSSGSGGSSGSGKSSGSYSSTGSQKVSVKTSNSVQTKQATDIVKKTVNAVSVANTAAGVVSGVKNALTGKTSASSIASTVKSATNLVNKVVSTAKQYSSTKKTTSIASKLISAIKK